MNLCNPRSLHLLLILQKFQSKCVTCSMINKNFKWNKIVYLKQLQSSLTKVLDRLFRNQISHLRQARLNYKMNTRVLSICDQSSKSKAMQFRHVGLCPKATPSQSYSMYLNFCENRIQESQKTNLANLIKTNRVTCNIGRIISGETLATDRLKWLLFLPSFHHTVD